MAYRGPDAAPASRIPAARRGPVLGRFCLTCGGVYALHQAVHAGKPIHGEDHVGSPCAHEGDAFTPGEDWWEPAVAVLPPPPVPEPQAQASQPPS
jgi:hypothetical protein